MIVSRSNFINMRNISDKIYRENQHTHFMSKQLFSPPTIAPFMGQYGKNTEPDNPRMTIQTHCKLDN